MKALTNYMLRIVSMCAFACLHACPSAYEPANLGVLLLGGDSASGTTQPAPGTPAVPGTPGFVLSTTALNIIEDGAAGAYTIRLNSEPTADVVITVTADANTQVAGGAMTMLTFTSADWETAQTVNVTGTDNNTFEGTRARNITQTAASTDADYNGLAISQVAVNLADDEKRIFVSATPYDGDLDTNSNGNPMPEADAFCQGDGSNPDGTATWKAMIVDGVNRRACSNANCTLASENIDWVLKPNTRYFQAASTATEIMTTNTAGIFIFGTLPNPVTGGADQYWTGLQTDWRTDSNNCALFDSLSGGVSGTVGFGNGTNSAAIRTSLSTCNLTFRLLCVEQ